MANAAAYCRIIQRCLTQRAHEGEGMVEFGAPAELNINVSYLL